MLRVLTYNILEGHDSAAEQRLVQATQVLQAARPDVLALNECGLLAAADCKRLHALETALGMQARLAHAASGQHVALLVREGVFEQVQILHEDLTHAALIADVQVRGRSLRVVAAHLDPYSGEHRLREVQRLLDHVQSGRDTLLLGDLNALSPRDAAHAHPELWVERYRQRHLLASGELDTRALAALSAAGLVDVHASLHTQTMPTRPTSAFARPDRPSQRLDHIFASPELASAAVRCEPFAHPLTQSASDHLPLHADFAAYEYPAHP